MRDPGRMVWLVRLVLVAVVLVAGSSVGQAENCPWLNAATAGGALGGTVTMRLTHGTGSFVTASDGTCLFTRRQGNQTSTMEIAVHTLGVHTTAEIAKEFASYKSGCGTTAMAVRAVGNEAVECTLHERPGMVTEEVVSRVRERVFVLRWSAPDAGDGKAAVADKPSGHVADVPVDAKPVVAAPEVEGESKMEMKLDVMRNMAEQVAGSLF